jgi:hypothetical protein
LHKLSISQKNVVLQRHFEVCRVDLSPIPFKCMRLCHKVLNRHGITWIIWNNVKSLIMQFLNAYTYIKKHTKNVFKLSVWIGSTLLERRQRHLVDQFDTVLKTIYQLIMWSIQRWTAFLVINSDFSKLSTRNRSRIFAFMMLRNGLKIETHLNRMKICHQIGETHT